MLVWMKLSDENSPSTLQKSLVAIPLDLQVFEIQGMWTGTVKRYRDYHWPHSETKVFYEALSGPRNDGLFLPIR